MVTYVYIKYDSIFLALLVTRANIFSIRVINY
jgi:hypothetical protein